MELLVLGPGDVGRLEALVARHPYNDYRHYRVFTPEARAWILLQEIQDDGGRLLALEDGGALVGLGTYVPLLWGSRVFGLPMAKIGHLLVDRDSGPPAPRLEALLTAILRVAGEEGARHLSIRIDCEDLAAAHALQREAFRIMDCLTTYVFHAKDPLPRRTPFRVRAFQPQDRGGVLDVARAMFGVYPSRYAADPALTPEGARLFYLEWVEKACSGEMADRFLVALRRGKVVGFLAYRFIPTVLKSTGTRIAGTGLSAVLPEGSGSYFELLRSAIELDRGDTALAEFDAQLGNVVALRTYQKLGCKFVRAKYAFHRTLEPAARLERD